MTEEEAKRLAEEYLHLLINSGRWGKVSIEVNGGKYRRVNITMDAKPINQPEDADDEE